MIFLNSFYFGGDKVNAEIFCFSYKLKLFGKVRLISPYWLRITSFFVKLSSLIGVQRHADDGAWTRKHAVKLPEMSTVCKTHSTWEP